MKTIGKCEFATGVIAAVCFGALGPSPAAAQSYPARTVSIVVPFGAGSITDGMARVLAEKLGPMWKQNVIVDNRPGLPGTTVVARSAADGHTLMLTSNGHTIAAVINAAVSFDPVKDFAGVTVIASVPLVAIVPADLPARTLKDFIALAAGSPGRLNFSSAGLASTSFLSAEIFRQQAKLNLVHIPYKGVPDATAAVIRGDVQMYFAPIPNARDLAASGKVRALAINSDKRAPQLPDVPTIAETAVPDYKYESWFGLMAPAGTPRDIRVKVSRDVAAALQMEDVKERLSRFGSFPAPTTPEQFDEIIRNDTERYAKVLRDAGVAAK
ncbi:MAG: tripartite tricarboxylate transporter substrate binding protein [Burkholderiales bacterium]|nr:tripartite tricarboxylate transporter substrate binding protein [Burkholderiales bacterium]